MPNTTSALFAAMDAARVSALEGIPITTFSEYRVGGVLTREIYYQGTGTASDPCLVFHDQTLTILGNNSTTVVDVNGVSHSMQLLAA